MWQVIAHGARELAIYAWYPMSSGFESNGYGLINLDGSITERAKAAGKIAKIVNRHASEILNAQPAHAQVAILYNRLSYMVGGSQPSLSKLGNAEPDSLMGLYRAFFEQQIPVDFVNAAEVSQNKLSPYKILFLPFPVMLSKAVAEGVKNYVENGGTVVSEARLAWNDERGFASEVIPGFGLDQVFGTREKIIRPAEHPLLTIQNAAALPGMSQGQTVPGDAYEEQLEPLGGAHVLAHFSDGQPAIISNSWGKGRAIFIGSFVALGYYQQTNQSAKHLFLSLAHAAGVTDEIAVTGTGIQDVEARRLVGDREQLLFVFNHASQAADSTISVALPWRLQQAHNLLDDSSVPFQMKSGRAVLHKRMPAGETWVVSLQGDAPQ
jgi:beta-galactosidase